jgi:hypothetical protein
MPRKILAAIESLRTSRAFETGNLRATSFLSTENSTVISGRRSRVGVSVCCRGTAGVAEGGNHYSTLQCSTAGGGERGWTWEWIEKVDMSG